MAPNISPDKLKLSALHGVYFWMQLIENSGNFALVSPIAQVDVEQALNRRWPGTPGRSALMPFTRDVPGTPIGNPTSVMRKFL